MTPRIPLRRCKRCVHFRRETCQLPDLDPCNYQRIDGRKPSRLAARAELVVAVLLFIAWVAVVAWVLLHPQDTKPEPQDEPVSAVALLRLQHRDEITPWAELQLAIMLTESRFDPSALGAAGDRGLYQMTPIYVAEVNRVAGTDYTPDDALDPATAVQMFAALKAHYNPTRDRDLALHYHHKGEAYRRAVLRNLELVRRYEAARRYLAGQ